jgi:hypothetical protein
MRAVAVAVVLVLTACGSSDSDGVDASGDAPAGGDGAPATDGGRIDAQANTCDLEVDCDACGICTYNPGGPCKAAFDACLDLPACIDLDGCVGGCGGDQPCIDACNAMYPDAVDEYDALFGCIACVCVDTCADPPPPGGC